MGSIQPQPLDFEPDGTLDLAQVAQLIKPVDAHFARTRLLCLENTQAGRALPMAYLQDAAAFGREHGLNLHLDGARLFNAAVNHSVPAEAIARHFDSVSFCLSKGLGAPAGSLFCGGREQAKRARRWRKVLGGGMRQSGILAAAGIFALENNIDRLAEDHANAALLADGLADIEGIRVEPTDARTNMVFIRVHPRANQLPAFLAERGILIETGDPIRLVTHLDVDEKAIHTAIEAFKAFSA